MGCDPGAHAISKTEVEARLNPPSRPATWIKMAFHVQLGSWRDNIAELRHQYDSIGIRIKRNFEPADIHLEIEVPRSV
jgi:hypothetical protein